MSQKLSPIHLVCHLVCLVLPQGRLWRQIFDESIGGLRLVLNTSLLHWVTREDFEDIYLRKYWAVQISPAHTAQLMQRAKSADAIFAIPEMSAQIVAAEEPITYNQGMLSHLMPKIWKKWDTFCQYWHYFLHCIGRSEYLRCCTQSDSSSWASQSSIHKITPKAAHQSWSIIVLRVNIKIKQCWKYNIIM